MVAAAAALSSGSEVEVVVVMLMADTDFSRCQLVATPGMSMQYTSKKCTSQGDFLFVVLPITQRPMGSLTVIGKYFAAMQQLKHCLYQPL